MSELEQIITCPSCNGGGWHWSHVRFAYSECPVCEARGFLVIDGKKTIERPLQPKPKQQRSR